MTGYSSTTAAPPESSNEEASSIDTRIATGISLMKGEDDPPIGPPEDYPLWLRNLAEAPSSLGQLTRADEDALSDLEVRHTDATDAFAIFSIVTAADSGVSSQPRRSAYVSVSRSAQVLQLNLRLRSMHGRRNA